MEMTHAGLIFISPEKNSRHKYVRSLATAIELESHTVGVLSSSSKLEL